MTPARPAARALHRTRRAAPLPAPLARRELGTMHGKVLPWLILACFRLLCFHELKLCLAANMLKLVLYHTLMLNPACVPPACSGYYAASTGLTSCTPCSE